MKKLLITAAATLVCVGAFAQGKLAFVNAANQLIYFTTDTTKLLPADAARTVNGFALHGSTLSTTASGSMASLAGAPSFTVALFAGATSNSLSQVATGIIGDPNSGGLITPQVNLTLAGLPAGTAAFFNLEVFDSRATSTANAWATLNPLSSTLSLYAGQSGVFSAIPQTSVYSPIWTAGGTVQSTMPVGSTFVPNDYVGFGGFFGSIPVSAAIVPEPGTLALAGLGLVSLLALRRRS
jgi:hypothetical protein